MLISSANDQAYKGTESVLLDEGLNNMIFLVQSLIGLFTNSVAHFALP